MWWQVARDAFLFFLQTRLGKTLEADLVECVLLFLGIVVLVVVLIFTVIIPIFCGFFSK